LKTELGDMEKENLIFYENLLQEKLKKANEALNKIKEEMENGDCKNFSEYANLLNHQSKYIASLNGALLRIKNGTFGTCAETGEKIPPDRLKLVPNSNLSVFAKSSQNKGKKK
jgi:RNA polymerase-binding transcription factor DksA